MAYRPSETSVLRGSIDNREKGRTEVYLEFVDGFEMKLRLKGNPHRDLGGRVLTFVNKEPGPDVRHDDYLLSEDEGVSGDITAARKVRVPLRPFDEWYAARKKGENPPEEWRNSLYLEWYSVSRGRCVLEATSFEMEVSDAAWEMSEEDEREAKRAASEALGGFVEMLGAQAPSPEKLGMEDETGEFQWEKILKNSDAVTERYLELLDKFGDDQDEEIAKHMGWDKSREVEENVPPVEIDEGPMEEWLELPEHPLESEAEEVRIWFEEQNLEKGDFPKIRFLLMMLCAKLAGALSGYQGDGTFDEKGLVIASLKRVLVHLDEAVAEANKSMPSLTPKLLRLRSEVIDVQQDLRRKLGNLDG